MNRWSRLSKSIYRIPAVRFILTRLRQEYLLRAYGLRTFNQHGSISQTIAHNLKSLRGFTDRSERLLQACLCIEDIHDAKSLIVGCRTEDEIFMFHGYGIADVTALDIISYSPWVVLGDMHNQPFADDSFDFVFCAYTLSYSSAPHAAAKEMVRIARNGAWIAVAIEYCPWERRGEIQDSLSGYRLIPGSKLETTEDILALFAPHVETTIVRYDAVRKRHHDVGGLISNPSPVIVIFSITKKEPSGKGYPQ